MSETIDMCSRHKLFKWEFELDPDKWDSMDGEVKKIVSQEWKMVKYMNDDGTELNEEINKVPDDKGGVYLFVLKPELIPKYHVYIMYIGRARRQKNFSLRKRCREYMRDSRDEIMLMRKYLGRKLYFRYLPLDDDDVITKVERELLRVILPPCNKQYPDYNILPAKNAF